MNPSTGLALAPAPGSPPARIEAKPHDFIHLASPLVRIEPSRAARIVSRILKILLVVTPFALAVLPWRQSVSGAGRVVGYAPLDRQLFIEAPLYGRIQEWFVAENTKVKKGDPIARISDNDEQYLEALKAQMTAAEQKLATAKAEVALYESIAKRYAEIREVAISAAKDNVKTADQKVLGQDQERIAAIAARDADLWQFRRQSRLMDQGLASRRDRELAEQKSKESAAKLTKAEADLKATHADASAKRAYLAEVTAKAQADISKSDADTQKALSKLAESQKELQDIEVKVRRQQVQDVIAPRDGTIHRLLVNQGTEQVKDGDPIAVLIPETADLAVELKIDGNDIPLVQIGDQVRLQFEGWPAVQFAGWPSVAVGTFGGRVALVDPTDDGLGKFRILVRPDGDEDWPAGRYLRQGVRTKGWVLLRDTRLAFEVWRRLNGFPQTLADTEPKGLGSGSGSGSDKEEKTKIKPERPK